MENKSHISTLKKDKLGLYINLTGFIRDSNSDVKLKYQKKCLEEFWRLESKKDFGWDNFEGLYDFIKEAELGDDFYHQESERIFYRLLNFLANAPPEVRTNILCAYDKKLFGISPEHYWEYLDKYFNLLQEKFFSDVLIALEND